GWGWWRGWGERGDGQGRRVRPHYLAELKREHARLLLVGEQLGELSRGGEPTDVPAAAARMAEQKTRLRQLKSFGPAFAGTLVDEVFYKEFDNRRQVGSYFGLAPSPWASGGSTPRHRLRTTR